MCTEDVWCNDNVYGGCLSIKSSCIHLGNVFLHTLPECSSTMSIHNVYSRTSTENTYRGCVSSKSFCIHLGGVFLKTLRECLSRMSIESVYQECLPRMSIQQVFSAYTWRISFWIHFENVYSRMSTDNIDRECVYRECQSRESLCIHLENIFLDTLRECLSRMSTDNMYRECLSRMSLCIHLENVFVDTLWRMCIENDFQKDSLQLWKTETSSKVSLEKVFLDALWTMSIETG